MKVTVQGKQIDVGTALGTYATDRLGAMVEKYFDNPMEGQVTFTRQGAFFEVALSVHVGKGTVMQAHDRAGDARAAFDAAADRMAKQLRRHKRKLRDHGSRGRSNALDDRHATSYVMPPQDGAPAPEDPDMPAPAVAPDGPVPVGALPADETA